MSHRLGPLALLAALCAVGPAGARPAPTASPSPTTRWGPADPPPLVLLLVIDQLRADYLSRFGDRLRPDGLRRFMEGAWFPQAEFQLMQCMTGPGHSVLLTGAWPARTGIPLNTWYDAAAEAETYCVADGAGGVSLRHLRAPTLGDALKDAGLPSKVISLSHKDRAALLMGGFQPDGVAWLERKALRWTTGAAPAPSWLVAQNRALAARKHPTWTWQITGPGKGLSEAGERPPPTRWDLNDPKQAKAAVASPLGGTILVDAALAAAEAHDLGGDATVDLLAVSFSHFDLVGHDHGPNDRRMEDLFLALDAEVARLLTGLERRTGPGRLLAVLTGDHGVGPTHRAARARGLPSGHLDDAEWAAALEAHLRATLGPPPGGRWVRHFDKLNLYLADDPKARAAAAAWLRTRPGVRFAFTREEHAAGQLPPPPDRQRILNQYVPGRSGDVVVGLAPYHLAGGALANHLTGYTYDRMVPLAFFGPGIRPGIHPGGELVDLAPTLAWLLGVLPPALSEGRVLREALAP